MDDRPANTFRVAVVPTDDSATQKLRKAIEVAGFKPGEGERQVEWVVGQLAGALRVYLWMSGRDPDTPEGERRLLEENLRKARAQNPQFKYAVLEPRKKAPNEGKRLAGFIKALKAAREHWRELELDTQTGLGLPGYEWRPRADGAAEFVNVDPLQALIERAERIKKERIGGRPKDEALEALLKSIVWEWWCVFVEDPRDSPRAGITYSGNATNDADRYAGPLLDFTCAVLKSHEIPCVRSALGRRLYDLVTKTWQMSRRENPPEKAN